MIPVPQFPLRVVAWVAGFVEDVGWYAVGKSYEIVGRLGSLNAAPREQAALFCLWKNPHNRKPLDFLAELVGDQALGLP